MKRDTMHPMYPSSSSPVKWCISIPITMMILDITSFLLSVPAAITGRDLMCFPVAIVNSAEDPFRSMANNMKPTISQENSVAAGCRHLSTEVFISSYPTMRTIADTTRLLRYSTLAWP